VVIGGGVHLSGHTVEDGVVKTAGVRLGSNVTIGLGSVIEIGVEIGSNSQVGALSFVPKYAKLKGGVRLRWQSRGAAQIGGCARDPWEG
jgi:UDP-3-O-[3-hydroxymyristoyl] glucosamine N-acyltransferase